MFKKILIANRGEIACRVIRTCRALGISSVAVYSEADKDALHVSMADEAVSLGESESKQSYLNIEKILKAAHAKKAEAIHPGYGFLSENADFARKVGKAKLTFIGPKPETIELLGDKVRAKQIAAKCGAPLIPGLGITDPESGISGIQQFAKKFGYPILVKAAAGGGGRGMRKIFKPSDIDEALKGASREAAAFFGDGRVFVEKLVYPARHIEVQVIGDRHGYVFTLGDRDCSTQRAHQKVIEEAPAPNIAAPLRKKIHAAAKRICAEAGYIGAGTVEFLLSTEGEFYFLEVNSRLQVEHPVTELVTGLDLVALQIRSSAGENLAPILDNFSGQEITSSAIECRICAESPEDGFAPSTGLLTEFCIETSEHLRVDTGFTEGDRVSHYYDSLLAKVIASSSSESDNREAARLRMLAALRSARIAGLNTNVGYLIRLLESKEFKSNDQHIQYAEKLLPDQFECGRLATLLGGLFLASEVYPGRQGLKGPWESLSGFRLSGDGSLKGKFLALGIQVSVTGQVLCQNRISIRGQAALPIKSKITETEYNLELNDVSARRSGPSHVSARRCGPSNVCPKECGLSYMIGTAQHYAWISCTSAGVWIGVPEGAYQVQRLPEKLRETSSSKHESGGQILSPLPGKILALKVKLGQKVNSGDPLLVLESMKMEHIVRAPHTGTVNYIGIASGDLVEAKAKLVEIG